MRKWSWLCLIVLFCPGVARAEDAARPQDAARAQEAKGGAREVNLLAMGDWGRNDANQRSVAAALNGYVKSSHRAFDAMLLAGDNFYVPLENVNDAKWQTMFERLYDPAIMDFPFYPALGNHDYQHDNYLTEQAYSKVNPSSRWKFPSRWYRVDFPQDDPLVTVLMLDSNMPLMGDQAWAQETAWIRTELEQPRTATWLICAAHHPFFSNGDHGDNGVLRGAWGPMFAKAKVDFFVAGHEHDLQHLEIEGWRQSFVLVGGGGATTRPMRVDRRGPFSKAAYGFASMRLTPQLATVDLIARDGTVLHEFTRTPEGSVAVTQSKASDVAIPRTIRSITRGGEERPVTQPAAKEAPAAH
jgi:hypothetical protein